MTSFFGSFHTFVPGNENAFWPFLLFVRGAGKSVSQFLKFAISRVEFLVNRVERGQQVGARPLINWKTVVAVFCWIMSWTVGHLSSFFKFAAGAS